MAAIEAQITHLADAIAYNNHDVDDGLRSKLEADTFARCIADLLRLA